MEEIGVTHAITFVFLLFYDVINTKENLFLCASIRESENFFSFLLITLYNNEATKVPIGDKKCVIDYYLFRPLMALSFSILRELV
jgi:hypothetical protein